MGFTIYSYGYSEIIYQTLNALAMFRNSPFYMALVQTMVVISGVILATRIAASGATVQGRQYLMQLMAIIAFVNGLLLPKTTMFIRDNVERKYLKVDNIPLAFALPIGITENFGHILTSGFEQAFAYIGSSGASSYYNYGTVFAARLSKEVLEAKIRDPEVTSNMRNFIDRCVVTPAMIGSQFTKEELFATDDIWKLVSKNAGTISRVDITIAGTHSSPTCKEAVGYFEEKFTDAENSFFSRIMNKFRGGGDPNDFNPSRGRLKLNIRKSILAIYQSDSGQSVSKILKHNMMINSLNDYRSGKFSSARAQMHSEAGGLLSGDMAEKTLTGSLAVMKVLIYGSFIFVIPLLILTGGIKKYGMWVLAAFSLQLWPPLFSMLNMIIDIAYDPAEIVSYSSWSSEVRKFDSIAATAANMTLMIPFLAMWITKLGEGGLMHLAGSIMATANSAASAIASEKSAGIVSYDNHNVRNSSYDMHNSGKVDHNLQYASGEHSYSDGDGTKVKIGQNGLAIMTGGAGITSSSGEASYNLGSGVDANLQQNFEHKKSVAETVHDSFNKSKANTMAESVNYLQQIANHTRTSEGYNIDKSTEHGKAANKALTEIDALNETNNHGWEQNARAYMGVDGSIGTDTLKLKAGVETSATNSSDQQVGEENKVSSEQDIRESRNNTLRALQSESFAKDLESSGSLGKDYRESYEETKRLEQQLAISQEEVNSASEAINYSKNHYAHSNQDVYQDVLDGVAREVGSYTEAKKLVDRRAPVAMGVFDSLVGNEVHQIKSQIYHNKDTKTDDNAYDNKAKHINKTHEGQINRNIGEDIAQRANNDGLNEASVNNDQKAMYARNKSKFVAERKETEKLYTEIQNKSEDKQQKLKEEIKDYDDNRNVLQNNLNYPKSIRNKLSTGRRKSK